MTPASDDLVGLGTVEGPFELTDSRLGLAHSLIWSISELHTNDLAMAGTQFGRRLATGPWVAALAAGLFARGDGGRAMRENGVRLGPLQSTRIRYVGPVRAGDRISVRSEVTAWSIDPVDCTRGVLTIRDQCEVESGQRALEIERTYSFDRPGDGSHE
jgi:acyl dehydratase